MVRRSSGEEGGEEAIELEVLYLRSCGVVVGVMLSKAARDMLLLSRNRKVRKVGRQEEPASEASRQAAAGDRFACLLSSRAAIRAARAKVRGGKGTSSTEQGRWDLAFRSFSRDHHHLVLDRDDPRLKSSCANLPPSSRVHDHRQDQLQEQRGRPLGELKEGSNSSRHRRRCSSRLNRDCGEGRRRHFGRAGCVGPVA